MSRKKVWLDVDTGIDDALGLMLACSQSDLEIKGISTVNGNVSLEQATANTRQVLHMIEKNNIPVYKGAATPYIRSPLFEHAVHGEDGLGGLADPAFSQVPSPPSFGPDQLIETVRQHKQDITLIFTGPLTNLAAAVRKDPGITDYVHEVIFMGGVLWQPGNITPAAEYNMYVDPEAARIVLHSGFSRLVQVGLDVTRETLLTDEHLHSLTQSNQDCGRFVSALTTQYRKRYAFQNGINACALHDPLAVAFAVQPDILQTVPCYVDVEYSSRISDGSLVADEKNRLGNAPNLLISKSADIPLFFNIFHDALASLPINEGVS